jgi:hypothetical protein
MENFRHNLWAGEIISSISYFNNLQNICFDWHFNEAKRLYLSRCDCSLTQSKNMDSYDEGEVSQIVLQPHTNTNTQNTTGDESLDPIGNIGNSAPKVLSETDPNLVQTGTKPGVQVYPGQTKLFNGVQFE